jgi:serine/threonine-protein kinase
VKLRSEPVNVCLSRARAHFAVNELFRPTISVCNRLEIGVETVIDRATGLAWQRSGSRYPLTFAGAHEYVEGLNLRDYGGNRQWRLPTVNELLSLLPDDGDLEVFPESLGRPVKWLWSCDRHGHHESWYVNMDMRFAGVQDVNCLNHVRAVAAVAL